MKNELKPCPFCSDSNVAVSQIVGELPDGSVHTGYEVKCLCCGNKTAGYMSKAAAVRNWNRRFTLWCADVSDLYDPDAFECSECGRGLDIGNQNRGWEAISYCPFCGRKIAP